MQSAIASDSPANVEKRHTTSHCSTPYYAEYCGHKLHIDQNDEVARLRVTASYAYSGKLLGVLSMPSTETCLGWQLDELQLPFSLSQAHFQQLWFVGSSAYTEQTLQDHHTCNYSPNRHRKHTSTSTDKTYGIILQKGTGWELT